MGKVEGSLYVNGVLKKITLIGGGFTDKERKDIWENFDKYRGRVLEVDGYQLFSSGALRHPNAVRECKQLKWRDDKPTEECVWPLNK